MLPMDIKPDVLERKQHVGPVAGPDHLKQSVQFARDTGEPVLRCTEPILSFPQPLLGHISVPIDRKEGIRRTLLRLGDSTLSPVSRPLSGQLLLSVLCCVSQLTDCIVVGGDRSGCEHKLG